MRKLILLFGAVALGAWGTTITLNSLPNNTDFGTYNGYIIATLDDVPNTPVICDDFDHTSYVPSGRMTYNLSTLTGLFPLQYARFVNGAQPAQSLFLYEQAAFLLAGLNQTGPGSSPDLTADYQYALWHLFTPSAPLPDNTSRTLLDKAAAGVRAGGSSAALLYSELLIYTPTAEYASNQEFLRLAPVNAPEPSTAGLFAIGGGLMALGYVGRRFRGVLSRFRNDA